MENLRHACAWLKQQLRIIWAIVVKDVRVFFRYPANAIMQVFEPIMWICPLYFMGKGFSVGGHAVGFAGYTGTGDYFAFVLAGFIMSAYITAAFYGVGYSVKQDMYAGVMESNWLTPAGRVTLIIGRSVIAFIGTTINSLATLLLASTLFGVTLTGDILAAAVTIIPMLIGLVGLGLGLAGPVMVMRSADSVIDISNWVVSEMSGSDFPVTVLPKPLLAVSLALPTTYGFDAVRHMILGTNTLLPPGREIGIMLITMVGMLVAGNLLFIKSDRYCRRKGILGTY